MPNACLLLQDRLLQSGLHDNYTWLSLSNQLNCIDSTADYYGNKVNSCCLYTF